MKSIRIAILFVALATTACSAGSVPSSEVLSVPLCHYLADCFADHDAERWPASPLEGMWATDVITCEERIAAVHRRLHGLSDHRQRLALL